MLTWQSFADNSTWSVSVTEMMKEVHYYLLQLKYYILLEVNLMRLSHILEDFR